MANVDKSSLIARLKAAHEAATPGPWEVGDHYALAGIGFGNRRNKCGYCDLPLVLEGRFDINGTVMPAHLHRRAEDWSEGHEIVAFDGHSEPVAVAGNYDYEAGGIVSPKDSDLIVLLRNNADSIIEALEERERLREVVEDIYKNSAVGPLSFPHASDSAADRDNRRWYNALVNVSHKARAALDALEEKPRRPMIKPHARMPSGNRTHALDALEEK